MTEQGYAIQVPYNQLNSSPFYIPPTHTIAQLFGHGEFFHGRTKAWKDSDIQNMRGIDTLGENYQDRRDDLHSDLSREELVNQFKKYKEEAILLNME